MMLRTAALAALLLAPLGAGRRGRRRRALRGHRPSAAAAVLVP